MKKPPSTGKQEPANWIAIAVIVAVGIAAHGLLLLTDYVIWDGWWIQAFLQNPSDWSNFQRIFSEAGRNLDVVWYLPLLGQSACVVISKFVSVLCWLLSGVLVYQLMLAMAVFDRQQAFMVAALGVTLPLYDVLGDLNSLSFTVPVPLFYAGWLSLIASENHRGSRAFVLRVLSALLFLASFTLPSLLVLFYAILAIWALVLVGRRIDVAASSTECVRRFWYMAPFALLPVVFWVVKGALSPAHGQNASYNAVSLNGRQFIEVYWSLVQTLYQTAVNLAFEHTWIVIVAVVGAVICGVVLKAGNCASDGRSSSPSGPAFIGAGVFLLGVVAFPYAAVNQPFAAEGWWTRCNILLNYPTALVIVGTIVWWQSSFFPEKPRAAFIPFVALILAGIGANTVNYASYQALGAKQLAVQDILAKTIREQRPTVLQVRDYFAIEGTINWYPPAIWSFIAAGGKTRLSTFVLDTRSVAEDQMAQKDGHVQVSIPFLNVGGADLQAMLSETRLPFVFEVPALENRQTLVVFQAAKPASSSALLGLDYLKTKFFSPETLPAFLDGLVVHQSSSAPSS